MAQTRVDRTGNVHQSVQIVVFQSAAYCFQILYNQGAEEHPADDDADFCKLVHSPRLVPAVQTVEIFL